MTINVSLDLARRAEAQPDELALALAKRGGGFVRRSFDELEQHVQAWMDLLQRRGVAEGERFVLMVPPSTNFFALTFALLRLGAVPVLVDPGMGVRNLGRCLQQARPRGFIGISKACFAKRLLGWVPDAELVLRVPREGAPRGPAPAARSAPRFDATSESPAAILFTSGSTGPAKGACYTHGMFRAQVDALRSHWGIEPGERDLATFPLFALFGPALGMAAVVPWMDASRPATADPRRLVEACQRYRCTNLFASPALIEKLGRYCAERGVVLATLRRALSAGAPASLPSLARFTEALPAGTEVHTPYGATESLPVSSIGSNELLSQTWRESEAGGGICVGRPLPGVRVKLLPIFDEELTADALSQEVALGEVGEITVCSAQTSPAYFGLPQANRLAKIVQHGSTSAPRPAALGEESHPRPPAGASAAVWHRMGDLGRFDASGRLWMWGRKGHRVTTAQGDLFTLPTEALFNRHAQVRRTALVGLGPRGEQQPVLWVEPLAWGSRRSRRQLAGELVALGGAEGGGVALELNRILFCRRFPVDVRHNAKIFREELARRAARRAL